MWFGMKRSGYQRNIWSYNCVLASLDYDDGPIMPRAEPHFAFCHFQARGVRIGSETEGGADDNGLGLRRCEDERAPRRLLLHYRLYEAVF